MARVPAFLLLLALCLPGALAQYRVAVSGTRAASPAGHSDFAAARMRPSATVFIGDGFDHRQFRRNYSFYGWPYAADYGYDSQSYEYPPPALEPQPAAQSAPAVQASEPVSSPVLLELHGDQWVQVSNFAPASSPAREVTAAQPQAAAKELPPAVLIFRDGHREEVSSYSIIGPVIYARADYWASGSWTRKIQIADLNVPATLQENQQRGVRFDLPSGPDEVMIRP